MTEHASPRLLIQRTPLHYHCCRHVEVAGLIIVGNWNEGRRERQIIQADWGVIFLPRITSYFSGSPGVVITKLRPLFMTIRTAPYAIGIHKSQWGVKIKNKKQNARFADVVTTDKRISGVSFCSDVSLRSPSSPPTAH